jgi:superfamily I DNA and/or RNA helicase
MGKLMDAFKSLEVEDGFNFKENLQNNISFVFGPPGTGKTTYVSNRICEIMRSETNCRILVLAPTNKACDVITERIASIANNPRWLGRFVATGSDYIEQNGLLCNRDTDLYEHDQCCLVSTIARLPYDGFVAQGGAPRLRNLDWEYVVIDEASMIPIAQIVYAIYRFSPYARVIVSGDPLQIPPIACEEEWAEENIYTMVNLNRFDKPVTEPLQFDITNLTTQYRSIPAIGEVFSRYSYAGLLKHYRSQAEQKDIKLPGLPMKPINFIQFKVEKYDNIFGVKKLAGSNVQIYSVLLIAELCNFISKKYKGKEAISVGIICPYVAESQMIERLIEQQEGIPENITFNVGTIHGFQGDECDIVFVVFNPPKAMASQPDRIMLNKTHIINVAISRAKDYLFLLIPHPKTEGFQNLYEIKRLGKIASTTEKDHIQYYTSDDIEQILFGKKFFLENNTFVTSHQMANVYTEPGMKYEVRIDENSVDVQIAET